MSDLARRMTLDRQSRILRRHPLAIVFDMNQLLAAELHGDRDAMRAGVNRILDQLFDDGGGPLDDLAGGNLVRGIGRELMNLAHDASNATLAAEQPEHRRTD